MVVQLCIRFSICGQTQTAGSVTTYGANILTKKKKNKSSPLPFPKALHLRRLARPVFSPLGRASVFAAWQGQCFRRLVRPVLMPLGGVSVFAAWRVQYLRRLAGPVFIPLGEPSIYAAWRGQYLRRLAGPVLMPLGGASIYAAWRGQYLRRLAGAQCLRRLARPVFAPLGGGPSVYLAWPLFHRTQRAGSTCCFSRVCGK